MPSERVVTPRRIDDDKVRTGRLLFDQGFHGAFVHIFDDMTASCRQSDRTTAHRFCAIFEIAMHRPLPMIEIESDDIGALKREGDGDMHCCRRFARSAFFIGEDNAMRLRNHQE